MKTSTFCRFLLHGRYLHPRLQKLSNEQPNIQKGFPQVPLWILPVIFTQKSMSSRLRIISSITSESTSNSVTEVNLLRVQHRVVMISSEVDVVPWLDLSFSIKISAAIVFSQETAVGLRTRDIFRIVAYLATKQRVETMTDGNSNNYSFKKSLI